MARNAVITPSACLQRDLVSKSESSLLFGLLQQKKEANEGHLLEEKGDAGEGSEVRTSE